jgi:hypothetical protein
MSASSKLLRTLLGLRSHEVELWSDRRRVAPVSALLLVVGVLVLALASVRLADDWRRHGDLEQKRATLETQFARLGIDPLADGSISTRGGNVRKGENDALADAAGINAELARPWHRLFDQLEAAQSKDVHLTQLSVDARFASLQLIVEGRDLDKLVRFSQAVSGGFPIQDLTITHHEWRDALGAHVVSASMQGNLAGASP